MSANPNTAPVGVNPTCGIPLAGADGSIANIANIIVCALSIVFTGFLIWGVSRRRAAVGECLLLPFDTLYSCHWLLLLLLVLFLSIFPSSTASILGDPQKSLDGMTSIRLPKRVAFWLKS